MNKITLILLALLISMAGCDPYPQDSYEEFYVIESYLVADRALPPVRLSTTSPTDEFYDFGELGVNHARVDIHLLTGGPGSDVEQTFRYINAKPGVYHPMPLHKVIPARTYRITATVPNHPEVITGHTVVPDTFHIHASKVPDDIVYQSAERLEITLSKSSYPGRQNIFIFNTIASEPDEENLTPFYASILKESDNLSDDLVLLSKRSTGVINEGNLTTNGDGTFTYTVPWSIFPYYRGNIIVANTIDSNIYDFVRSQQVQLGGSTLSAGEIQNVINHVEGGIGVFGSLASDSVSIFLKKEVQ